jgi:hypothetical protein
VARRGRTGEGYDEVRPSVFNGSLGGLGFYSEALRSPASRLDGSKKSGFERVPEFSG